jgi:hypothetical protein
MTMLLLTLGVLALLVLAGSAVVAVWVMAHREELDVIAAKLMAEQRIEQATRETLRLMRNASGGFHQTRRSGR